MSRVAEWFLDWWPCMLLVGGGFGLGWVLQGTIKDGEIARIERTHADEARERAEAQALALKSAIERGDRIYLDATARETDLDAQLKEKTDALRHLTTGRPCLGGAALRLLNAGAATGIRATGDVLAGAFEGAAAGPPTDSTDEAEYASDTDIATWIATAQRYYRRCTGRLDDIRAFDDGAARYGAGQ